MAWFSKAEGGKIEQHDKKLWALFRCKVAVTTTDETADALGVYKRDPSKYPDEPNLLPGIIAAAQSKKIGAQIKSIMGRKRAR